MRVLFDVQRDGLAAINAPAEQLLKARMEITTGRRVNVASDDPLSARQAVDEHATLAGLDAYSRTGGAATSRLSVADSALASYVDKLTAAIVTAQGAQGSHATADSRAAAAAQITALRDGLLSDINSQINGVAIFSGAETASTTYVNSGSGWTYQGDSTAVQVAVGQGRLVSITFDGQALAQGADAQDVFTALDTLASDILAGDNTAIAAGIDALGRAQTRAAQVQGRLGADERTIDDVANALGALKNHAETRRAKAEDADLADAITRMNQANTAYQAALSAVSTAERRSLLDYLR